MCLTVDLSKTNKFKKNLKGFVWLYKVIDRMGNYGGKVTFETPYQSAGVVGGFFKSDAESTKTPANNVYEGIHVFTAKSQADKLLYGCRRLIKVKCYRKDLIAIGQNGDAVFTKVFIPKSELDKHRKSV